MPLFRPTLCEINLSALRHNFRVLKEKSKGREMMAVVKANAYGHGAATVARTLVGEGAACLGVATVEEGIELRRAGLTIPILCLGGPLGATASDLLEYQLTPVVFNAETVRKLSQELNQKDQSLDFHLKVDTGMGRLGILPEELPSLLSVIQEFLPLQLKGVMTHLARADEPEARPTEEQFAKFKKVEAIVRRSGFSVPVFHIANSAALIEGNLENSGWVRPGIALYGAYPHPRFKSMIDLQPVMSWKTQIISLKNFPKGSPISYGATFKTRRPSQIGVIPVGYADGYSRFFSNKGEVLVHGRRVPVVGRVCMDLTMIDLTDLVQVALGDEVVLMGKQGAGQIRAEEMAEKIGTISYEIFCAISARVPRIAVAGGESS